jgi:hypothetical protein
MNDNAMLKPALIGGVLLGILSSIPVISLLNCACCAWVVGGGMLAAYLYVKDSPLPVTLGRGAGVGLLTGVIGTAVSALFMIPLYMLIRQGGLGIAERIREVLRTLPNVPPEAEEAFRGLSDKGDISPLIWMVVLIFTLATYSLAAMLGGVLGVALFEKRKPGVPSAGPPPQEPIRL